LDERWRHAEIGERCCHGGRGDCAGVGCGLDWQIRQDGISGCMVEVTAVGAAN
jgi:hypothetical protein